jgi:hypothetical protein
MCAALELKSRVILPDKFLRVWHSKALEENSYGQDLRGHDALAGKIECVELGAVGAVVGTVKEGDAGLGDGWKRRTGRRSGAARRRRSRAFW